MEGAEERRARLRAMREAALVAEGAPAGALASEPTGTDVEPVLKFRNYALAAEERIQHEKVEPAPVPDFEDVKVDADAALGDDPEVRLQRGCHFLSGLPGGPLHDPQAHLL